MKPNAMQDLSAIDASSSDDGGGFGFAYRLETPLWVFDIDNARIVKANKAACDLWEADSEEQLFERELGPTMSSSVSNRLRQYQSDFLNTDQSFTELWTLYPNGVPNSLMVVFKGFDLPDGRKAMLCEAVGASKEQPDNVRSSEALLHTDVMISLFSRSGPPLYLNPAARNAFLGPNITLEDLFENQQDCVRVLRQVDQRGELRIVTKLRTINGVRWFDLTVKNCLDAATGDPALLFTCIDVSELKEARDTARHLADRDQLTNLYNRSFLQSHLAWLEERHAAQGCAIVFFDVDRFKQINDRYGHEAGDEVLRNIALRARSVLNPEDMIARLGGDEFIVVIEGNCDQANLETQIKQIRQAIAKPIMYDQSRFDISVSVGVARYTEDTESFSVVLRQADIALYVSKQGGRDQVTVFSHEMGDAVAARDRLEVELQEAVERNEFVLHFQPRLDIRKRKIVGVEGLVRWNHPTRGLVMPDSFISVCEETGLIEKLGQIVLELGCQQAIEWHRRGMPLNVSLNVSPRQFSDPSFLDSLRAMAAREGFPHGQIELEITENVLIGDDQLIAEKLKSITAMGYGVAIDDFGTGYSNLAYISRFPLTCLKIDRSFIDQLPATGPLVQLILTLGEQIGASVVSEGVETLEQLEWLNSRDCAEAQGYLITRPIPADQMSEFISEFATSPIALSRAS